MCFGIRIFVYWRANSIGYIPFSFLKDIVENSDPSPYNPAHQAQVSFSQHAQESYKRTDHTVVSAYFYLDIVKDQG